MQSINNDISDFNTLIKNNKTKLCILFLVVALSYFFDLCNNTINIDNLAYNIYYSPEYAQIASYRWGYLMYSWLTNTIGYYPFVDKLLSIVCLLIDAYCFSFLLYLLSNKNSTFELYLLFSVVFVSYPLINEMWNYGYLNITISYFLIIIPIILMYYKTFNYKTLIVSSIILTFAFSNYESVTFAYITIVLIVLFLKYCIFSNTNNKKWIIEGMKYAVPLVIAFILKYLVGYIIIIILNVNHSPTGATGINWLNGSVVGSIKEIIYNGFYYLIRGLSYFPILEFAICLIFFFIFIIVFGVKNKNNNYIFIGLSIIVSLFFVSLIQGKHMPYRMAETIHIFIPFVSYLFGFVLLKINWKRFNAVLLIVTTIIGVKQGIYLHEMLYLNYQRSNNESNLIQTIGYRLYSEYDINKTVVFCGQYQLGEYIEKQIIVDDKKIGWQVEDFIRKKTSHNERLYYDEFVQTNVNSVINWSLHAFQGQELIKKYFSYYGYDINVMTNLSHDEEDKLKKYYEEIAIKENMKPYEIKDMGEYILVYFGKTLSTVDNE